MIKVEKTVTGTNELTLEVAKLWMKVDGSTDDSLITSLIDEARVIIDQYLNYTITPTTITVTASSRVELCLPYPPVVTITTVKDEDGNDVDYTYNGFCIQFDTATYSVTGGANGYVTTVTIYDAGMANIPAGLMLAWKEVVLYLYENRGDASAIQMMLTQNKNLQIFRSNIWV